MNNLLIELIKLVQEQPGKTGREYARTLRSRGFEFTTKSDVNHTLYGYPIYFEGNIDERLIPHWKVTSVAITYLNTITTSGQPNYLDKGGSQKKKPETPRVETSASDTKVIKRFRNECRNDFDLKYDPALKLYAWQDNAFNYWKANNYQAIIQAVTGSGKTRLALAAVDSFIQYGQSLGEAWKVLIVVPTKDLMMQWFGSIQDTLNNSLDRSYKVGLLGDGFVQSLKYVDILVGITNSVSKYNVLPKGSNGLFIGDECHHFGTENSYKVLEESFCFRLGLTAYLERVADNGVQDIIVPYFNASNYRYGYSDAIEDKVIAPFEITFVIVEPTSHERVILDDLDLNISKLYKELTYRHPELKNAGKDDFWIELNKCARGDFKAIKYRNLVYKRRSVVVKLKSKLDAFSTLASYIKKSQGCFGFTQLSETAANIESLLRNKGVDCRMLDGKVKQDYRTAIFSSFRNNQVKMIVAPKLLDEGIDVPRANLAIITGRNKTMRQSIQRIGRVVRRKDENGKGYIIIIASKGTIEDPNNSQQDSFYEIFDDPMIKISQYQYPSQTKELEDLLRQWKL